MSRPKPGHVGDQKHLTWGSIRWSVARQMRLAVEMVGDRTGQYAAILAGSDVLLTREQVAGLVPPNKRPANLAEHEGWVLSGDDTLKPYKQRRKR
jgi:hypothetical protein